MKKNALIILPIVFIISILIGGGSTYTVKQIFFTEDDEVIDSGDTDTITPPPTTTNEALTLLQIEGPNPNPTTRKYSLTVEAEGGEGELIYSLCPVDNPQQITKNHTGIFDDIPYTSNGRYTLIISDESNNELIQTIDGFKTIYKRYTLQELTNRLSTDQVDRSLEKHFVQNSKLHFLGIKTGDPVPTGHQQIHSNISALYWERVEVIEVDYNEYNKIKSLTIQVYYTQY